MARPGPASVALVMMTAMIYAVAAKQCSLATSYWTAVETEDAPGYTDTWDFREDNTFVRTLKINAYVNCSASTQILVGVFTVDPAMSPPVLQLFNGECSVSPVQPNCIPCSREGNSDVEFAFSANCDRIYVNLYDFEDTYYAVSKPLPGGAVAGIVLGVMAALALAGVAYWYWQRNRRSGYWEISSEINAQEGGGNKYGF